MVKFNVILLLSCIAGIIAFPVSSEDDEPEDELDQNVYECFEELDISLKDVSKLTKLKDLETYDDKSKVFLNCLMAKEGFIIDGVLQEKTVLDKLAAVDGNFDASRAQELINRCRDIEDDTVIETTYKMVLCLEEKEVTESPDYMFDDINPDDNLTY